MKAFLASLFSVAFLACHAKPMGMPQAIATFNPFKDHQFFISPTYKPKVLAAAAAIEAAGDPELAAKARKVAEVPTFLWISDIASIPSISSWLTEATAVQKATGQRQVVTIVIYNLPDRDCGAKASAGELIVAEGGEEKYQKFIQDIKKELEKFPDIRVVLQIETDAIGNFITGQGNPKCSFALDAQKRSLSYAFATLQLENVALYLDGAHAGWLGWSSNINATAEVMVELIAEAVKINPTTRVRGVSTNVSNYNGLGTRPDEPDYDELIYAKKLAALLLEKGWDAHFIVDQGRSGNRGAIREGAPWCNWSQAGFGLRPTADTPDPLIDAIVWVKPGGEADGTSNSTAVRFDENCGLAAALQPAPEAGSWFQAYFEQLLKNANPPF